MHNRSSSWVLVVALWLAFPEQYAWAAAKGGLQPSTRNPAGWSAQVNASNKEPGLSWRSAFTKRAAWGLALTGSGVFFIEKGFDFHREADALYGRYLDALNPDEISLLYQRTTQRDLKSRLSWTLGAVLAASGIHVLFGRQLAALHLEVAPPFPDTHPWAHSAQVQFFREF